MSDQPKKDAREACKLCGRRQTTHLSPAEFAERFGYARVDCTRCGLTDHPRGVAEK